MSTETPKAVRAVKKRPVPQHRIEQAVLALLQQPTAEKAAAAIGVSPPTLWRWSRLEEFREAFRLARRDTFSQAIARLQQASSAAVSTLLKVMVDPNAPAASRVRAAGYVLEQSMRGMELEDIEVRIGRLEATASQDGRSR